MKLAWFVVFISLVHLCVSQKKKNIDFEALYNEGKAQMLAANYAVAIKSFTEVAKNEIQNSFSPQAYYYLGLSYYNDSAYKDANYVLYQLIQKYPDWQYLDFAYYLKGLCQMQMKNYFEAMLQWSNLQSETCKIKANESKKYYFQKINVDTLALLARRFPNDKVLIDAQSTRLHPSDNVNQIAILLPFDAGISSSQDIFDMYSGMRLAIDSLKRSGIEINVCLFESKFDTVLVNKFINDSLTKYFTAVVGPLFQTQQEVINGFSSKNNIYVVNPNSYITYPNPYYRLLMPSAQTKGAVAARFCLNHFKKRTSLVFYGKTKADTINASAFKSTFERMGGCVQAFRCMDKNSASWLPKIIDQVFLDSVACVYVSSKEPLLAANIYSTLEAALLQKTAVYKETTLKKEDDGQKPVVEKKLSAADVPIIAPIEWLNYNAISYEQFVLHNTHFLYPSFIKTSHPFKHKFDEMYIDFVGVPPGYFSYIGYDAIFLSIKKKSMTESQKTITLPFTTYVLSDTAQSNAHVPIVKLEDYELKLTNPYAFEPEK